MGIEERLKAKGWTQEEIDKAMNIMESDKARFSAPTKKLNKVLYWTSLFIAILGNFIIAIAMVPILLFVGELPLYIILAIIGVSFGALYTIIIRDIEFIDPQHHIVAGLFLPAVSITFMVVVVKLVNDLAKSQPEVFLQQNVLLIPLVYVVFFMAPYAYIKYSEWQQKKKMGM